MKASFKELLRSAALAAALGGTLLGLSACDDSDPAPVAEEPPPPPPPPVNIYEAYPTAIVQEAAPSLETDLIDDVESGTILTAKVEGQQRTLYTFKNDTAGVSTCNINADKTGCAKVWPPLFAGETAVAAGDFTLITRTDGLKQWAWRDFPLYFFAGGTESGATEATPPDESTGDTNGFLFNDIWFVVRPDPFEVITLNDEAVFVGKGAILDYGVDDTQIPATTEPVPVDDFPTARSAIRDGFTLYTFDNDLDDGISKCYTNNVDNFCSKVWPPLYADLGTIVPSADYTVITRPNGTLQWSYKGKPLYYYVNDPDKAQTDGTIVFPTTTNGNTKWSLAYEDKAAFTPDLSLLIANVFQNASGGNCSSCHGATTGAGGLELGGTQAEVLAELLASSSNAAYADKVRAVAESPDTSLLVHKLEGDTDYGNQMPLGGTPLAADVIAAVRQWIGNGARDE